MAGLLKPASQKSKIRKLGNQPTDNPGRNPSTRPKVGLVVMDKIWDNGFRQLTTGTRPVASLADLKGMKIRVPVSPIFTSMMKALGASPASANINELYSALQTKVFDGQENPLTNIQYFRIYEVQKFCALTSHMWEGYWLIGNRRAFARMPADLQT